MNLQLAIYSIFLLLSCLFLIYYVIPHFYGKDVIINTGISIDKVPDYIGEEKQGPGVLVFVQDGVIHIRNSLGLLKLLLYLLLIASFIGIYLGIILERPSPLAIDILVGPILGLIVLLILHPIIFQFAFYAVLNLSQNLSMDNILFSAVAANGMLLVIYLSVGLSGLLYAIRGSSFDQEVVRFRISPRGLVLRALRYGRRPFITPQVTTAATKPFFGITQAFEEARKMQEEKIRQERERVESEFQLQMREIRKEMEPLLREKQRLERVIRRRKQMEEAQRIKVMTTQELEKRVQELNQKLSEYEKRLQDLRKAYSERFENLGKR